MDEVLIIARGVKNNLIYKNYVIDLTVIKYIAVFLLQ